jgi:hypothetical protein
MGLLMNKKATPSNPAATKVEVYYDTAPPGYTGATPKVCARDENGVVAVLAGLTTLDYRLLKVTPLTAASGNWTPTVGCRAAFVELVAGGGQGGGGPAGTGSSAGGGGGAGAYAASWITGVSALVAYVNGAGGSTTVAGASTGQDGADTTWGATTIVAKGGKGGLGHAISTTILTGGLGGAGGLASACTGDIKVDGAPGGTGLILSTAAGAISGQGAPGLYGGGGGVAAIVQANGNNGVAPGSGGSGGCTFNSAGATKGGTGGNGTIIVWEFA